MPRYFFDTRDGEKFVPDEMGIELENIQEARDEAAEALADLAHDVLPGSVRRELAVEVHDDMKRPLFRALLVFEVEKLD